MTRLVLTLACLMLASGCAKKYCEQDQSYQQAREGRPLSAPPGLEVPAQDPNLRIPEVNGNSPVVTNESRRCLEIPPHMRESG